MSIALPDTSIALWDVKWVLPRVPVALIVVAGGWSGKGPPLWPAGGWMMLPQRPSRSGPTRGYCLFG